MKKFLGFIVDLLIVLVEIGICAGVVFYLISHPIIKQEIVSISIPNTSAESRSLAAPISSTATRSITSLPAKLDIPPVIWIPDQFIPERQWGYDRVYSCTRLERVPGFWHIGGYPPLMINDCPVYVFYTFTMIYP